MQTRCYWCGEVATSEDHVPAKGFYPVEMRNNLIRVPSCTRHNTGLSKLDERFLVYLQSSSASQVATQAFGRKTSRGLMRPKAAGFRQSLLRAMRPATLDGQAAIVHGVSGALVSEFFEKVARGLYFYHSNCIFNGTVDSVCSHISRPGTDWETLGWHIQDVQRHLKDGQYTHPGVFKYRYGVVEEPSGNAFVILGTFYGDITFFTVGIEERT